MFLVTIQQSGPEFDRSKPLDQQSGWEEHADFMDALVESGDIILGGPIGDGPRTVHAWEAESEAEIRATMARDPWADTHLVVESVEPWTIRLDGTRR